MKHPNKPLALTAAIGVMCLLVGASSAALPPSQAPISSSSSVRTSGQAPITSSSSVRTSGQAPSAETPSMTATVGAVDTKARTLEMITGVGHALRLVRMQVEPTCHILVAGAPSQLGDLKRGNIILIQYRRTAERNLAEHIETFHLPSPGDKR